MDRQRSLAREQVRSTLPDRSKGWRWSPKRRENGIGWSTDRPSQLHFPHTWRLVRLHPVLSDKLLEECEAERFVTRRDLDRLTKPEGQAASCLG